MNKPQRTDYEQLNAYLTDLGRYESEQIERLKKWIAPFPTPPRTHTIKDGHRFVFVVQNSLGQRAYFDNSLDAVECERTAHNQPCRLIVMPIMPKMAHHFTPLDKMKYLIEDALRERDDEDSK